MLPTTVLEPLPLDSGVEAFYTLRGPEANGVDSYSGFNVCHYVGDREEHVSECRRALALHLRVALDHIIIPRQVHSARVAVITSLPVDTEMLEEVDGVVTNLRGLVIGVSTADCLALLLVDTRAGVVGAIHAGWRGALAGVIANGVKAMETLGADPSRIRVAMGPSICKDCFEVGEEVAVQFPAEVVDRSYPKPHIDLALFACRQLENLGIPPSNIQGPPSCTRCHPRRHFSARALGIASGRQFTFVLLKSIATP
ncbi:MAG: peptidoglycan editing factor PgeF [Bacteroidales bacterium]|nr:peptidoglycan editing factor PgeF [Bacteroidales bacterium]